MVSDGFEDVPKLPRVDTEGRFGDPTEVLPSRVLAVTLMEGTDVSAIKINASGCAWSPVVLEIELL